MPHRAFLIDNISEGVDISQKNSTHFSDYHPHNINYYFRGTHFAPFCHQKGCALEGVMQICFSCRKNI